jgi:hypothetical protein
MSTLPESATAASALSKKPPGPTPGFAPPPALPALPLQAASNNAISSPNQNFSRLIISLHASAKTRHRPTYKFVQGGVVSQSKAHSRLAIVRIT